MFSNSFTSFRATEVLDILAFIWLILHFLLFVSSTCNSASAQNIVLQIFKDDLLPYEHILIFLTPADPPEG